ncbi:MAG: diguanylate cyclase, partial [Pseudomonadota bacterium]
MVVHYDGAALFAAWFLVMYAIYLQALVVRRVRASDGDVRLGWWIGGALTVGTGLWAQSFIGLLSLQLPIPVGYMPAVILSTWLPAVVVSGISIWLAGKAQARIALRVAAGVFVTAALCFIPYLNVSAMVLNPGVVWNGGLVALALLVILIGCAAGSVMLRRELVVEPQLGRQLLFGVVLGSFWRLGQMIMQSAAGVPGSAVSLSAGQLTGAYLEWILTGTVVVLFVLMQLGTMLDARWRGQQARLATSLQQVQAQLQTVAHRDTLTGLLNRQGFEEHLSSVLQSADELDGKLAVMRINLDGFRALVNTYGHALGDTLLRQVANRLLVLVRSTDAPARSEGEEFLLLLRSMPDALAVTQLAHRIGIAVSQPCVIQGEDITVSCSIGIAMY